jgi:type VI secretion system protein
MRKKQEIWVRSPRGFRIFLVSSVLLVAMLLAGCGLFVRTRSLLGGRVDVFVTLSETANGNHPVAVDLLIVRNPELLERLLGMGGREWFAERDQIRRDFLPGEDLDVWSWEWVPGQRVPDQEIPLAAGAKGGLVFAEYLSPGAHRARFDPFSDLHLTFRETGFEVRQ